MSGAVSVAAQAPPWSLRRHDAAAVLEFHGDWRVAQRRAGSADLAVAIGNSGATSLSIDCSGLGEWDSALVVALLRCQTVCAELGIEFDPAGIPGPTRELMALAREVAPHRRPAPNPTAWLRRLLAGVWLERGWAQVSDFFEFIGEVALALLRLPSGRSNTRLVDFLWFVQQAGPAAIGIVTLISVLVGMILAYLGSVQLQQFGAQIYVADLVGIGMVREMGALMTGVIMAGRTGAAYAAQLGTMQTREEIDAIRTLGISPIEFLVVPRMLALVLVMPMLCLYSDVLGILGGALVALGMDVSWTQFVIQTREAVTMTHIATGLVKSVVFGLLIAVAGCRAGIRCGRSSEAVGQATTTAVVTAIVYLIIADAAFNILYQRLGI